MVVVFVGGSKRASIGGRAEKQDPHQFILRNRLTPVEVGRIQNPVDLYRQTGLLLHLSSEGIFESLALLETACHTLPHISRKVLLFRPSEQQKSTVVSLDDRTHTR